MGPIGAQEMIAIFVIALLLFGPKKLPELGRTLGKALSEFRKAKDELKSTFESHLHELDREAQLTSGSHSYKSPDYSYNHPDPAPDYNAYDGEYHSSHNVHEIPASSETVASVHEDAPVHTVTAELVSSESLIAGTVPRSNGVHPASNGVHSTDVVSVATEEKYSD